MWYYALDNQRKGPVDKDEIQRLIDEGDLGAENLVWTDGMEEWTPISEVDDLHPSPPPLPQGGSSSSPASRPNSSARDSPAGGTTAEGANSGTHVIDSFSSLAAKEESDTAPDIYAGFGRRLVAYFADFSILAVFSFGLWILIIGLSANPEKVFEAPRGVIDVLGFLATWIYFALSESSRKQATWGKQLLGLRVTDLTGGRIGFWKATGRHFGKILSSLIFFMGYVMAAFTEKHQALHDKMAGCLVIEGSEENSERFPDTGEESQVKAEGQKDKGEAVKGTGELYCKRSRKAVDPIPDRRTYGEYTCPSCRQDVQDGRHPPVEEVRQT